MCQRGHDRPQEAHELAGNRDEARRMLLELTDPSGQAHVAPYNVAVVYAALDERDRAFEWLESAYEQRDSALITVAIDPDLDPLREDPRFHDLLGRIGLPWGGGE